MLCSGLKPSTCSSRWLPGPQQTREEAWCWAPLADCEPVHISSSELCCLLPPTPSHRYWAAVATQFLTVTLPSAANQLPASQSPSFKTHKPPQLPACGGCDS